MLISSIPSRRRGISSSAVFASLVVGVLILVLGFVIGRQTSNNQTETPDAATETENESTPVVAKTNEIERDATSEPAVAEKTPPVVSDAIPYKIEPPELDFGIISPGTELRGSILITNVSDKPLTISKQISSCKCTVAQDLSGKTLQPGESVELNPLIEARTWNGTKRDKITLVFAGYSKPATMWVKSNVARAIIAEPPFIYAARPLNQQGTVDPETPQQQAARMAGVINLRSRDEKPFRILALNGGDVPYLGFDPARDELKSSYRIRWDLKNFDEETCRDEQGNPMLDWWVVETDHPDAPIIDLRVRHRCTLPDMPVRADFTGRHWFPKDFRVVLDEIKAGVPMEFELPIKWVPNAEPDDTIVNVVSLSDQFTVQLLDTWDEDSLSMCRIEIIPDDDLTGLLYGKCKLYSTHPGHNAEFMIIARVVE